jgi:predicted ribosome-associated RNA-binding protein Tma20
MLTHKLLFKHNLVQCQAAQLFQILAHRVQMRFAQDMAMEYVARKLTTHLIMINKSFLLVQVDMLFKTLKATFMTHKDGMAHGFVLIVLH